jgi:hypothetical protein
VDYEKQEKKQIKQLKNRPPNTLILANAITQYHQVKNRAIRFDNFDQTIFSSVISLYSQLLLGKELFPAQQVLKTIYLKSAIDIVITKIGEMVTSADTIKKKREGLNQLERYSDILNELTESLDRLN